MRKGIYTLVFLLPISHASASDVVITGVMDGPLAGGTPKAIELYVTRDIADLSAYAVGSANNGGGSDGEELTLSGVAGAGDFVYIASDAAPFAAVFGFAPQFESSVANVNGDDALELFHNGEAVDVFGEIDTDGSGEPWEYADSWAYRVTGTGPDGTVFQLANWTFGETLVETGLAASVPFGGYSVTTVPLPAAVWLLGSGLVCLFANTRMGRKG